MIKILEIPGNGIGPIVTECGIMILKHLSKSEQIELEIAKLELTEDEYLCTNKQRTDELIGICKMYDYILFGAVGVENKASNDYGGGLILELRQKLDLYVNFRPAKQLSQMLNPLKKQDNFDLVIVRENTECAYINMGDRITLNSTNEIAIQTMLYTKEKTEKTIRYAFELAKKRRKKLTLCDKSNVLKYGHGMWKEIFYKVAKEYDEVNVDHYYVDSLAAHLVKSPANFDVIVTTNMFGDILSDIAAQLQGGIATAGSLNFGDWKPVLVEPVHGAAFDLTDKKNANPMGVINSIILMLNHMGLDVVSLRLENALTQMILKNKLTPDLGGTMSALQFVEELLCEYSNL